MSGLISYYISKLSYLYFSSFTDFRFTKFLLDPVVQGKDPGADSFWEME